MDFLKLEEFINLAKKTGASKLKYENKEEEFCVEFGQTLIPNEIPSNFKAQHYTQHATVVPSEAPFVNNVGLKEIKSPFVGTFYRSSSPQNPYFVKVGDIISTGKTLCIIEAMKIMNEIEADCSGEIVEICLENETYVEYGQVLFRIKS